MPNNKHQVMNMTNNNNNSLLLPSTAATKPKKSLNEFSFNNIILVSPNKTNQEKQQSKRLHLSSPHSSCGSSTTGSAFSSYCTTSCNSSTCSRRKGHNQAATSSSTAGSRSEFTNSDSSTISSSGSCESDCQHSHSKSLTNTYSNSNLSSSCSSSLSSQSSQSISPNSVEDTPLEDQPPVSQNKQQPQIKQPEKRFTRSSISASDLTISSRSSLTNSNTNTSDSDNNSTPNSTHSSTATLVTTKVTRSTSNSLKKESSLRSSRSTGLLQDESVEKKHCDWYKCKFVGHATDVDDSMLDHIKLEHIYGQKNLKRFRCMWKGCGVYSKPAFSFNWLERHVVDHIEKNPFMCIFDGCKRKFRTEEAREKHCQCHINNSENTNPAQLTSSSSSPVKIRNHLLLNSAKLALIQNIKNKTSSSSSSTFKSSKPSMNYSQILKTLTKKRKTQAMTAKKFKKAQFKDFLDDFSIQSIGTKLTALNYNSGKFTFNAEIIACQADIEMNTEMFLIQWNPKNIIENEWIERTKLGENLKKEVCLSDLKFKTTNLNPFYRSHRFRENRRK